MRPHSCNCADYGGDECESLGEHGKKMADLFGPRFNFAYKKGDCEITESIRREYERIMAERELGQWQAEQETQNRDKHQTDESEARP